MLLDFNQKSYLKVGYDSRLKRAPRPGHNSPAEKFTVGQWILFDSLLKTFSLTLKENYLELNFRNVLCSWNLHFHGKLYLNRKRSTEQLKNWFLRNRFVWGHRWKSYSHMLIPKIYCNSLIIVIENYGINMKNITNASWYRERLLWTKIRDRDWKKSKWLVSQLTKKFYQ